MFLTKIGVFSSNQLYFHYGCTDENPILRHSLGPREKSRHIGSLSTVIQLIYSKTVNLQYLRTKITLRIENSPSIEAPLLHAYYINDSK